MLVAAAPYQGQSALGGSEPAARSKRPTQRATWIRLLPARRPCELRQRCRSTAERGRHNGGDCSPDGESVLDHSASRLVPAALESHDRHDDVVRTGSRSGAREHGRNKRTGADHSVRDLAATTRSGASTQRRRCARHAATCGVRPVLRNRRRPRQRVDHRRPHHRSQPDVRRRLG